MRIAPPHPTASPKTIVRAFAILTGCCWVIWAAALDATMRPDDKNPALRPTAAMVAWSRSWLAREGHDLEPLERLRRLHDLLVRGESTAIREIVEPTPTAAEAFATRRADCVGFALLLASLANVAGVPVDFALVDEAEVTPVEARGTLRIRRLHLAVTASGRVFDLGGESAFDPRLDRTIGERSATALYLSNRGAQTLAGGRLDAAIELLWNALRFDNSLASVWTNLGVALRRRGDSTGAILAHEMALRLDPSDATVRNNLALARAAEFGSQERR
jgi:tetratricopeptide (TPR) repeat protein